RMPLPRGAKLAPDEWAPLDPKDSCRHQAVLLYWTIACMQDLRGLKLDADDKRYRTLEMLKIRILRVKSSVAQSALLATDRLITAQQLQIANHFWFRVCFKTSGIDTRKEQCAKRRIRRSCPPNQKRIHGDIDMPDSRPAQTYSTLLEDRRIIESAAEANESPSLVVHLLEKDWSIRPGRAPNNAGARRFSYSEPISGLLDDIQARRIPVEFTDIFKKLDVKFFEGCLIVEMHDSRPTKGGPSKNVEARIDKYVLRPTAESLWAEIRNVVDGQQGWGDKEALELEARIVLATAPPLCLDPSPTVNRIANVITRIGAYPTKTSLKRRQSEDTEDDIDSLKRRKLMQLMNPRVGKPFVPKALMHKDAASQRPPVEPTTVPTTITNGGSVVATSSTMAQGLQLRPNVPPTATTAAAPTAQPIANVAQAGLAVRPRPMPLKIGPDAQHAATLSLAARNRISAAQNLVAAAQGGRPLPQVAGQ
ncbi:3150_t:CDS:2, partial [Acaulospora colombiana]